MKKLLLILLCVPLMGFGQNFELTFAFGAKGYSVQQTTDGGYIISGFIATGGGSESDGYLIKTDGNGNGNVTSEVTIPLNSNRELEKVVDILGRDINPEKNKPFIEIYNDGTVEKKIIIE